MLPCLASCIKQMYFLRKVVCLGLHNVLVKNIRGRLFHLIYDVILLSCSFVILTENECGHNYGKNSEGIYMR